MSDEQNPSQDVTNEEETKPVTDEHDADDAEPKIPEPNIKINFTEDPKRPYSRSLTDQELLERTDEYLSVFRDGPAQVSNIFADNDAYLEPLIIAESELSERLINEKNRYPRDDEGNLYIRALAQASENAQLDEVNDFAREGSHWTNGITHEGKSLNASRPGQDPSKVSDRNVARYMLNRSKIGSTVDVPLYSSGIWLRIRNPSLIAIAEMQDRMAELRISLGTWTKGMSFSNTSQTIASIAFNFALDHVEESNVHFSNISDLKERISQLDMNVVIWAFACTMYPDGFDFVYPCLADVKQEHLVRERLNLMRLFWADEASLTKHQKAHMAKRFTKVSDDDLKEYRKHASRGDARNVIIDEENGFGVELSVPTLADYENYGSQWIQSVVALSGNVMSEPPESPRRQERIDAIASQSIANWYGHWVSGIVLQGEGDVEARVIRDEQVIDETLTTVFSDSKYSEKFLSEVRRFIADSKISVIAIPSFKCPTCNTPVASKFNERYPHLVELDALSQFFTLSVRKLA